MAETRSMTIRRRARLITSFFLRLLLIHLSLTSLEGADPSTTDMLEWERKQEINEAAQKKTAVFPCLFFFSLPAPLSLSRALRRSLSSEMRADFFFPFVLVLLSVSAPLSLALNQLLFLAAPLNRRSPPHAPLFVVARPLVPSTRQCRVLSLASRWRDTRPARPRRRRGVSEFEEARIFLSPPPSFLELSSMSFSTRSREAGAP